VHKRGEFIKILISALISQSGSHFLTIALSAMVFSQTGSAVKASLIFVLTYLPSVFVSSPLGGWIDRTISKRFLAANEVLAIAISILCGACVYYEFPIGALCAAVAIRSLLLFTSRTAMTKWVKVISPQHLAASRIKLFFLSFFLSTVAAGVLASLFLGKVSIWSIIAIDAATYSVGLIVISLLQKLEVDSPASVGSQANGLFATVSEILSEPMLKASFIAVCFSQSIFQGAYSILVSYLPMRHFGIGLSGTGIFQIAASVGIIGGFLVNWRFPNFLKGRSGGLPLRLLTCTIVGIFGLLFTLQAGLRVGVSSFFVLNLAYECIWLFHSSEFFANSPVQNAARYQFTLSSVASFLMASCTLGYAALIDQIGAKSGVALTLSIGLLAWLAISRPSFARKQAAVGVRA
jgi:hypothetical protein